MTGTPAAAAFLMTAAPVSKSRLTIISTFTPPLIMLSAMDWNLALSPPAFWMSNATPAVLNASVRNGLSAVSHRVEDVVSGRMTPILPPATPGEDDLAVAALLPPDESPLHAVRAREPAAARARTPTRRLRMPNPSRNRCYPESGPCG